MVINMKKLINYLSAVITAVMLSAVNVFASAGAPATGDNSITTLPIVIACVAVAIILIVILMKFRRPRD